MATCSIVVLEYVFPAYQGGLTLHEHPSPHSTEREHIFQLGYLKQISSDSINNASPERHSMSDAMVPPRLKRAAMGIRYIDPPKLWAGTRDV